MIDRRAFFDGMRNRLFHGRLSQQQVDGASAILDEWENRFVNGLPSPKRSSGFAQAGDLRWLAYMLATAKLETAHTMQPIGEYGGDGYFFRMYDKGGERPSLARALGNTQAGDGVRFHGRGYVQLTGRGNYARMAALTGVDLVGNPDLALDARIAALIMFDGMRDGLFTGVGLPKFFHGATADWVGARRIINGQDRAAEIAGFGQIFHDILKSATERKAA